MQYGKVPDIQGIETHLKTDEKTDLKNSRLLKSLGNRKDFFYLGLPVWKNPDFKNQIYPKSSPEKDFLKHYSESFNAIELNSTYYANPRVETIRKWKETVGEDFFFCCKFPQKISANLHVGLKGEEGKYFYETLELFEENLGTGFLQFNPDFDISQFDLLKKYIETVPNFVRFAIEFRHPSWFAEENFENVCEFLRIRNISLLITDTLKFRELVHMRLTAGHVFVRFSGHNLHESDFERLDEWVLRLTKWKEQGLSGISFFLHTPNEGLCPELAFHMAPKLCDAGFNIRKPILRSEEQMSLI